MQIDEWQAERSRLIGSEALSFTISVLGDKSNATNKRFDYRRAAHAHPISIVFLSLARSPQGEGKNAV